MVNGAAGVSSALQKHLRSGTRMGIGKGIGNCPRCSNPLQRNYPGEDPLCTSCGYVNYGTLGKEIVEEERLRRIAVGVKSRFGMESLPGQGVRVQHWAERVIWKKQLESIEMDYITSKAIQKGTGSPKDRALVVDFKGSMREHLTESQSYKRKKVTAATFVTKVFTTSIGLRLALLQEWIDVNLKGRGN